MSHQVEEHGSQTSFAGRFHDLARFALHSEALGDGGRSIGSNCSVGCLNRGDPAPAVFNAKEVEVSSVAGRMGLRAVVCLRATRSRVLSHHTSENVTCQRQNRSGGAKGPRVRWRGDWAASSKILTVGRAICLRKQ
jgi:hypothetical protein